jgi:ammonia channel protein AmtB
MGWFGFNGGSVLALASKESANAVAMVFLNTNAAAAGGVITALLLTDSGYSFGILDLLIMVTPLVC